MTKTYESSMRPAAINQVFIDQMKGPTLNSWFEKSVLWGMLSCTVATINPVYSFFYGFARGTADFPLAKLQYLLCFGREYAHREDHKFNKNDILKILYVATHIFGSIAVMYALCKIGELALWGSQSLIGRVEYSPFSFVDLLKIEAVLTFFSIGVTIGLEYLDATLSKGNTWGDGRSYSWRPSPQHDE